ncbi:hypothetical protein KJ641_01330 [Patescibacteria group bacterium]|nr:hypothetical protein [Patescibacteria group bacterium]
MEKEHINEEESQDHTLEKEDQPTVEQTKTEETEKAQKPKKQRKCYLHSALMPILFWLIFGGLFYFFAYDLVTIKFDGVTDPRFIDIFTKYSVYMGLILGLLSMIGGYIVYFILVKLKLKKFTIIFPLLAGLMTLPWYLFARQLIFFENKFTDMARGIIFYIGGPLLSTTKVLAWLILIWAVIVLIKMIIKKGSSKKIVTTGTLLVMTIFLSGCTGNINEWACQFFDNPDHCLQNAAVQEGDTTGCEKIKGEDFADSGSNPPRDKCYLRIAENTGDLSVCNKIEGGMFSYTKEECILSTSIKFDNPSGCALLSGADRQACIDAVGPKVYPGSVINIDDQIALLKEELKNNPDSGLQAQLDDLEKRRNDYLGVMSEKNKSDYESLTDPMNKQTAVDYYAGRIDEKTKNSLTALNDSLREKGEKLSDKEYQTISAMLAYKNNPENDIENMDDTEIVKLRWNEKLGNAKDYLKFWNANPTEKEKKYDESLLFYQRMLERQEAINKGLSQQQQDFDREAGGIKEYIKGQVYDKAMDEAKKAAFGELLDLVESDAAGPVTAILGEAIDTVKKEAKSAEFRGLVRAYNLGMEEELSKAGGDVDKAHEAVTKNLQDDPYRYEDSHTYAHYQNLLQNKDCDGTNPHCIQRDVFWKAMKKSFKYQQK